jgi:hypothetical protein
MQCHVLPSPDVVNSFANENLRYEIQQFEVDLTGGSDMLHPGKRERPAVVLNIAKTVCLHTCKHE